jgi:hypothetical protein
LRPRNQAVQELYDHGYIVKRHGGRHDIYYNPVSKTIIPLKRHDFDETDLRYIQKEIASQEDQK